jgi:hypothetical protein
MAPEEKTDNYPHQSKIKAFFLGSGILIHALEIHFEVLHVCIGKPYLCNVFCP